MGDLDTLVFFGRPFNSVDALDEAIVGAWRALVGPDDVIVCVGDATKGATAVQKPWAPRDAPRAQDPRLRQPRPLHAGFDAVVGSLYAHGDPPLLLTHVPLRRVPAGCVNVHGHGHLHQAMVRGSIAHINVSVEQVGYRPQPLARIRRLARHLDRGWRPVGRTTVDWLSTVRYEDLDG